MGIRVKCLGQGQGPKSGGQWPASGVRVLTTAWLLEGAVSFVCPQKDPYTPHMPVAAMVRPTMAIHGMAFIVRPVICRGSWGGGWWVPGGGMWGDGHWGGKGGQKKKQRPTLAHTHTYHKADTP